MQKTFLILIFFILTFCIPSVTAINFNINAAQNIDSRIALKHAATNKPIYSTQNHVSRTFVRNPECWAADLDLTCISPSNNREGNFRAGTLITKRHVILVAHYNLKANDSIYFVTKDNITIRRKIIAHKVNTDWSTNVPDIEILTLNEDVPESITPCHFLPSNYGLYLTGDGDGLPVLYTDQQENALVADIWSINSSKLFELQVPILANRLALNESVVTGDSGNPVFLILNGKPVIFGCFTWGGVGYGNALTYYANLANGGAMPEQNINDLIVATDAIAGINTGYKISFFDFTATATANYIDHTKPKIKIKNRLIQISLSSLRDNSELTITDMFGKIISNSYLSGLQFEYHFENAGVYIVSIRQGSDINHQKVIVK
jgi:hypothetical protein